MSLLLLTETKSVHKSRLQYKNRVFINNITLYYNGIIKSNSTNKYTNSFIKISQALHTLS